MRPRVVVSSRYLSFGEREQIALWRVEQVGVVISPEAGSQTSTIAGLSRNGRRRGSRICVAAQAKADRRALVQAAKLATSPRLRLCRAAGGRHVQPEQISALLRIEFRR